jgi:hypothetical protein
MRNFAAVLSTFKRILMYSTKTAARVFGAFFLLSFLSYGCGSGMVASVTGSPEGISAVAGHQTQLIFGAILMGIVHTAANIGLIAVLVPVLKRFNATAAAGYSFAAFTATILLTVGAVFLLVLVPIGDAFKTDPAGRAYFEILFALVQKANFFAYQVGMTIWGIGGLLLCRVLFQSKLVPRPLAIWGFAGYLVFSAGTVAELFGYEIGVLLSIPGGLFELFLSLRVLIKGFAIAADPEV